MAEAAHEETLEAMESFLNLGADEVDIRTIQSNFSLVDSEVRSDITCREAGSSEALPLAVRAKT